MHNAVETTATRRDILKLAMASSILSLASAGTLRAQAAPGVTALGARDLIPVDVAHLDPRRGVAHIHEHAAADVRRQVAIGARGAIGGIMQRRIGMGAGVERRIDLADVDRAAVTDLDVAHHADRRLARPDRHVGSHHLRDIPDPHGAPPSA